MTMTSRSVDAAMSSTVREEWVVDAAQRRLRGPWPAREAAVGRAPVVARAERAERGARRAVAKPLDHELAHHATYFGWVPTVAARAMLSPSSRAFGRGLDVEVEHDFHVIAHEADRRDDHRRRARGLRFAQRVTMSGPSHGSRPYDALLLW